MYRWFNAELVGCAVCILSIAGIAVLNITVGMVADLFCLLCGP